MPAANDILPSGQPLTLIYIAGTNYSGTTLLASILGCHPRVESLGQAFEVDRYQRTGGTCMCGASLPLCPFWSRVLPMTGFWHHGQRRLSAPSQEFSYGGAATSRLGLVLPVRPASVAGYRAFNLGLLRAAARVSGRTVLVDSSKSPHRLEWLVRSGVAREVDLRVVQVTRDGLGVMSSYKRRGRSALRGALAWRLRNARVEQAVRRFAPRASLPLRYEQLCADPGRTVERICRHAGLPFDPRMLDFRSREQHQVGGNPMRFGGLQEIRLDLSWREDLSPADRAVFWAAAGCMQREYGYAP